jgi:LPXTG-motif cell wall-anchored protein
VNSLLQTLTSELNSLLNILGVHLNYVEGTGHASADGKFATATGPEYDIVVDNPISTSAKDKALVVIGLGHGTTASVSAAQATRHVTVPNQQLHSLPHTGANLPLIAGGGLALLIGAAVLRRRVMV